MNLCKPEMKCHEEKPQTEVCVQMIRAQGNDNTHERAQHINEFNRLFYLYAFGYGSSDKLYPFGGHDWTVGFVEAINVIESSLASTCSRPIFLQPHRPDLSTRKSIQTKS